MTGRGSSQTRSVASPDDETLRERELLAPYLARPVIEWAENSPELRHRSVEATVAFVDISGFTKLSEGLAKHGKIGAEELAATIGNCFVELLDLAYANGGRLIKFGGDALLLSFIGPDHAARGCRAAFEMRLALRTVGRLTVLGQHVQLRMSVGVHSGSFDVFLVGSSHRELVITGPAASTTVAMESAATAGEILVSEATATAAGLRGSALGEARAGGRLLRRPPRVSVETVTPRDPIGPGPSLAGFVPTAILGAIRSAHHEPEHRRATVAFIHFDGTDEMLERDGPEAVADYLEGLVSDTQAAVDREEVTFLATDIDHDGGKIILAAGAPSSSGDDEQRMLLALREIVERPRALPIRVGVNRGPVFAGDIGPPYRRTFTVMGDTVNLAARLMAKATPGTILATPAVPARSASRFELVEVPPFYVKGKAQPIQAVEVGPRTGGRQVESGGRLPLVGREREVAAWQLLVEGAAAGGGGIVELIGEAGVGKSRLVEEFRSLASAAGMELRSSTCEYYAATTPYGALRDLVRELLGIGQGHDAAAGGERLTEAIGALQPELLPWAPLVAAVAHVEVAPTTASLELDPSFRAQRLAEVMTELLDRVIERPAVFVFEDTHWMDDASAELLRHITVEAPTRPWLFCLTRRDVETGLHAPDPAARLHLQPLTAADAVALVHAATAGSGLLEREAAALAERSGGNPLFLRELVAVARDESIDSLPDSVEAVIAARIDRLSNEDRQFLRRVSVLGRSAPLSLVPAVLDHPLDKAVWTRLTEFVAPDGSGAVSFRHALLRDGAYDGLSYRLRRELHGRVGDAIRSAAGDNPAEQSTLLSLHYLHAQRFEEAFDYALVAAESARSVFANVEAAELFERALQAARRIPGLGPERVAAVHESLADTRHLIGEYAGAVAEYQVARRIMRGDHLHQALVMFKLSRSQGQRDRYSTALRWISRALSLLESEQNPETERQRALLAAWYARFCQEQGHHEKAMAWCSRAIAEAERSGHHEALALALAVLDWARMDLGTLDNPDNWERSLALMEELGDLQGQATLLNSLGMLSYFRGCWDDATKHYLQAQERARRVGNSFSVAVYEGNAGEIAIDQGRVEDAEGLFQSLLRTSRTAGHRMGAGTALCNLGRCAARSGRFGEAEQLFSAAYEEAEAVGNRSWSLEIQARWAEAELLAGEVAAARQRAGEALQKAQALGGGPQLPLLHRIDGVALARLGDIDAARAVLDESVATAEMRQADYERGMTLHVMAELGMEHAGCPPEELRAESERILGSLGVVRVPDLLARDPDERATAEDLVDSPSLVLS